MLEVLSAKPSEVVAQAKGDRVVPTFRATPFESSRADILALIS